VITRKIEYIPDGASSPSDITKDVKGWKYKDKSTAQVKRVVKEYAFGKLGVTVRLQGIDAPELHYRIKREVAMPEYRQLFAETSVVELYKFLSDPGNTNTVDCLVTTSSVDQPTDAFDVHARFVGDVFAEVNGSSIHINKWLVQKGLAFPAFYNSMTNQEIQIILDAIEEGRQQPNSLGQFFSARVDEFDEALLFRNPVDKPIYNPKDDKKAPVIIPQIFRRLVRWYLLKKFQSDEVSQFASFVDYFLDDGGALCCLTSDFLKQGTNATTYGLADFLQGNSLTNITTRSCEPS
jgi:endonuclease YncB( thermonuclease family)